MPHYALPSVCRYVRKRWDTLFVPGKRHEERVLDAFELMFVTSGTLRMWEADQSFSRQPGQTLLLWPGRRHGGDGEYPADLAFFWIHFQAVHEDSPPVVNALDHPANVRSLQLPRSMTVARPERVRQLFHQIMDDHSASEPNVFRMLDTLSADMTLLQILCEVAASTHVDRPPHALALRAKAFIDANFHRPIGPSAVARSLGYTPAYLGELFRDSEDLTLTAYLRRRRLQEAKLLLLHGGGLSLKEIAAHCGFTGEAYFARIFRRFEGATPSEYRKLQGRLDINVR